MMGVGSHRLAESSRIRRHLMKANPLGVQLQEGGVAKGRPCGSRPYDEFAGIEDRVVEDKANWILNSSPSQCGKVF